MRIEFKECLEKGLIRKVIPSSNKAKKGIEKAEKFLEEAKLAFKAGALDSCLLTCYQSIFLAAKSVLFKDGYREKSHACVARYLEEIYVKKGKLESKWVELLDRFRNIRHDDEYNVFFFAAIEDCKEIMDFADGFILEMKRIILEKEEKDLEKERGAGK